MNEFINRPQRYVVYFFLVGIFGKNSSVFKSIIMQNASELSEKTCSCAACSPFGFHFVKNISFVWSSVTSVIWAERS